MKTHPKRRLPPWARAAFSVALVLALAGPTAAQGWDMRLGIGPTFTFNDMYTGGHAAASLAFAPGPGFVAARLSLYAGHNADGGRDANLRRVGGEGTTFVGTTLGGELRWKQGRMRPYLLAGLGYYTWSGWDYAEHDSRLGFDLGLGLEAAVGNHLWFVEFVPRMAFARAHYRGFQPPSGRPVEGHTAGAHLAVLPVTFGVRF